MKDKLRELADTLRRGDCNDAECLSIANEINRILDAEGDDWAVPSAYMVSDNGWNQCFTALDQCRMYGHEIIPLYTHPARSGVVSDEDVNLLKGLESLCGFVQNGSDTVIKLFQDDATRAWFCKVGNKDYWAPSFRGAIHAAIQGEMP